MRNKNQLKIIGYWSGGEEEGYPHPREFVDEDWNPEEKELVIQYLDQGKQLAHYKGKSWCRFGCTNVDMGSREFTDGEFAWPEGFKHYLEIHSVKPPLVFIEKCKANFRKPIREFRFGSDHSNLWWIRTSKQKEKEKLYTLFGEGSFDQLEAFQNFYNKFQADLNYQLEHIDFPIPIFLGNYFGNMKMVYLEKDLWQDLGLALIYHKYLSNEKDEWSLSKNHQI